MIIPSYEEMLVVASGLHVLDQGTATLQPFKFNREQRRILKALCRSRRVVVLKGRQVGCSTVVAFFVMMVAIWNPGLPCCVIADDHDKSKSILAKVRGWLVEIGITLDVDQKESIQLENGAVIDALTAKTTASQKTAGGESKAGRARTYAVIHATEMAFWENAASVWASLTSTETANSIYCVESSGAPGQTLFKQIVDDADKDGWEPFFIGVEQHAAYRADPNTIDDERWEELREVYGFSENRRDTAAWWWRKLWKDLKGDATRMRREFPITPADAWTHREGLHIATFTECRLFEEDDAWNYYVDPKTIDEPVVLGVDTSEGVGQDSSALSGVGLYTGKPLFTWKRNDMSIANFIAHIKTVRARFNPIATIIEKNGAGAVVWQAFRNTAGCYKFTAGSPKGEVKKRRDELRDDIVTNDFAIAGHLVEEAKSSQVRARRGADGKVTTVFIGADDALSATSFARDWRKKNPKRRPEPHRDPGRVYESPLASRQQQRF